MLLHNNEKRHNRKKLDSNDVQTVLWDIETHMQPTYVWDEWQKKCWIIEQLTLLT